MIFMTFNVIWDHYFLLLTPVLLALISPVETQNQVPDRKSEVATQLLSGVGIGNGCGGKPELAGGFCKGKSRNQN